MKALACVIVASGVVGGLLVSLLGQTTERPTIRDNVKFLTVYNDQSTRISIVDVRGHEYIVVRSSVGSVALTHAASCPCLKPKPVKDDKTLPPGAHILLDDEKSPAEKPDEK